MYVAIVNSLTLNNFVSSKTTQTQMGQKFVLSLETFWVCPSLSSECFCPNPCFPLLHQSLFSNSQFSHVIGLLKHCGLRLSFHLHGLKHPLTWYLAPGMQILLVELHWNVIELLLGYFRVAVGVGWFCENLATLHHLHYGYSIHLIWGPDYWIENFKGAKGEGHIKLEIKFKFHTETPK